MNNSKALLRANSRIVPSDLLLKFGGSPYGGIEFDSANDLLSFSYNGATKADLGLSGVSIREGNGLVIGHAD